MVGCVPLTLWSGFANQDRLNREINEQESFWHYEPILNTFTLQLCLGWRYEGISFPFLLLLPPPPSLFASSFIVSLLLLLFCFLGLYPRHMEVPRLGVKLELSPPAYTTATATQHLSHVCSLHHSSWQCRILNPLSEARDRTRILMDPSWIR